jgi:hypothetical protein
MRLPSNARRKIPLDTLVLKIGVVNSSAESVESAQQKMRPEAFAPGRTAFHGKEFRVGVTPLALPD